MAPSSGYKGVGLGLMVEVFAAALAGAELGIDAAPFSGTTGGPPRTGQFFIAVNPLPASEGRFAQKIARLAAAIADQEGARLPGARRLDARTRARTEGVPVDRALVEEIEADRLTANRRRLARSIPAIRWSGRSTAKMPRCSPRSAIQCQANGQVRAEPATGECLGGLYFNGLNRWPILGAFAD
jgi:hypothetical protein